MPSIDHLLILSAFLFLIGLLGILTRKNAITLFMCVELILNAVNLCLVAFAQQYDKIDGILFAFFIIVLAAAEAVVGLSIIVRMEKEKGSIEVSDFNFLQKG